jgi:hypothetical protein
MAALLTDFTKEELSVIQFMWLECVNISEIYRMTVQYGDAA